MISASHNPYPDNGIKLFEAGGRKLRDETEEARRGRRSTRSSRTDAPVDGADGPGRAHRGRRRASTPTSQRLVAAAGGGTPFASAARGARLRHTAPRSVAAPRALRAPRRARSTSSEPSPTVATSTPDAGRRDPELVAGEVVARECRRGPRVRRRRRPGRGGRRARRRSSTATTSWRSLAIDLDARGALRGRRDRDDRHGEPRPQPCARAARHRRHRDARRRPPRARRDGGARPRPRRRAVGSRDRPPTTRSPATVRSPGILLLEAMVRSGRPLPELAAVVTKYPQVLENVRVARREGLRRRRRVLGRGAAPPRPSSAARGGCWCGRRAPSRSCG